MKIFALEGSTVFASLSTDEFAQLEGFPNSYLRNQARRPSIRAGVEVDLEAWCKAAQYLTHERRRLETIRESFAKAVAELDGALAAVGEPEIST